VGSSTTVRRRGVPVALVSPARRPSGFLDAGWLDEGLFDDGSLELRLLVV